MFPDITYFFYYFFDIKPDGILSFIKTYGLFQTISFGLFYYFTYEVIKERIVTDFNILNKVNFSRIVLILLIPTIILIFKIAIISKLILILILISIYFIDSKNFSLKQKYFFFLVTLLIIGFFGSTAQIIIEDYIISNKIMHSGRLGFFGGAFFIFLFLVYIFKKFPFSIDIINKNCKYVFLSYSIGKLGCHLSGDGDWGKVNNTDYKNIFFNILFKCSYKYNVINEGCPIENCKFKYCYELCQPVYPVPFLESIFTLFIFIFMTVFPKSNNVFLLLIIIGLMRLVSGFFVINEFSILSYSQIIAIFLIVCGLVLKYKIDYD